MYMMMMYFVYPLNGSAKRHRKDERKVSPKSELQSPHPSIPVILGGGRPITPWWAASTKV
jgi:hypothetical protein